MKRRRVVVTGAGVISPLGHSLQATTGAIAAGHSAIAAASLFDARGFQSADAAEIADWDPRPSFRLPKALKLADRPARFAVASAQMALDDGRYPRAEDALVQLGVALGSSGSDLQARDLVRALGRPASDWRVDDIAAFGGRILDGLNPLWLLVSLPNMTSAHVAIQLEAHGPNTTIMSDWTAGHQAIGEGALWVDMGEADAVLAGGADCAIQPFAFAAFEQAGLLPAAGTLDGLVPSEGAAVFLLEDREAAAARGVTPWAELRGYAGRASSGDGGASALADALADALTTAGWSADEVTVCGVTRPATTVHRRAACDAVSDTFGGRLAPVSFSGSLGFALAAAAPIELAVLLATHPASRVLSGSLGSSGEAVALAFETAAPAPMQARVA
jgi:3-oxoacyl-[acyl-carrier-protein] synthase II